MSTIQMTIEEYIELQEKIASLTRTVGNQEYQIKKQLKYIVDMEQLREVIEKEAQEKIKKIQEEADWKIEMMELEFQEQMERMKKACKIEDAPVFLTYNDSRTGWDSDDSGRDTPGPEPTNDFDGIQFSQVFSEMSNKLIVADEVTSSLKKKIEDQEEVIRALKGTKPIVPIRPSSKQVRSLESVKEEVKATKEEEEYDMDVENLKARMMDIKFMEEYL
ncbi:hypothetical protein GCK72_020248 [Caenorhabditis remanei]|uniref:Uncharacterized protein n=1 Tax=Caenorhabditis remanei TaxID=31234 RepID=A0A6A5GGI0_CAERE|nr:hypothetical protein GCK72_020248 [Caenorhabditis remanei]KAF1753691.1 hypothetical protein GCK72_020248 [Caenorhabditis remanei]